MVFILASVTLPQYFDDVGRHATLSLITSFVDVSLTPLSHRRHCVSTASTLLSAAPHRTCPTQRCSPRP